MKQVAVTALLVLLVGAQVAVAQNVNPGGAERPAESAQAAAAEAEVQGEAEVQEDGLRSRIAGLPFTGVDLVLISGIALLLTGMGFAVQRLSA